MFLNVRVDGSFVETPYLPQRERLAAWLRRATGNLLVLEIGAGFNMPSVVRWPLERIANQRGAPLVRVNPAHPEVPVMEGAWGIAEGAQSVRS